MVVSGKLSSLFTEHSNVATMRMLELHLQMGGKNSALEKSAMSSYMYEIGTLACKNL